MEVLTRIGPYTIIEPIGSGGMGEIYRAHDADLDRDVAIKVLHPSQAENAGLIARFQKEGKIIAALSHPNIVTIYACGFDAEQGLFWIAMELLDGETLREYVGSRPIPWRRAVKMAISIADGLRAAHVRDIIHRDLKPDNVFVTKDGLVKILDFGLAHRATDLLPGSTAQTLTTPGSLLGTPGYMSPEQARGETADARTDIFAFGCLLYEMLSGHRAFTANSIAEFMTALLRDHPEDLRSLAPDVPEELVRVVEHCLEKKRELRFQTCSDLMFALVAATDANGRPMLKPATAMPRRFHAISIAALLVTLLGTVYLGSRSQSAGAKPIRSVAIMPFATSSTNSDVRAAADGLTQGVINNLSPAAGFRVTPWNSVSAYKEKELDPRIIRSDLSSDAVVVGRIQRQDSRYLATIELIDARDNSLIWGDEFNGGLPDIQRDISIQIAQHLEMPLTISDERRIEAEINPEAYRLYTLGQYDKDKRSPQGLATAIALFRQALEIDPQYADAWAGIADCYVLLGGLYEVLPPREAMPKAKEAALAALALDPKLASAHASLGLVKHEFDWDWPAAEREFKKAIELNANCVEAHQWYGQSLVYRDRIGEGLRELEVAEQLDPRSLVSSNDIAQAHWIAGDYDAAIAKARSILEVEPNFYLSHWIIGLSYAAKKQYEPAISSLEQAVRLGAPPAVRGTLGYVYGRAGRRDDAVRILEELKKARQGHYMSAASFALIYESLGDRERAWEEVERAYVERASLITAMYKAPLVESIRSDPRYPEFARRVGLPPLP